MELAKLKSVIPSESDTLAKKMDAMESIIVNMAQQPSANASRSMMGGLRAAQTHKDAQLMEIREMFKELEQQVLSEV